MVLIASQLRIDKRCGKSGIPDNRKCSKQTAAITQQSSIQPSNSTGLLLTSAGALTASTVLGVLTKDIYSSGVPADKVPPKEPPDGLYDSFKPGDLIYQTDEFAGAQRAHYAVYLGKLNGVHKVFDTSLKKIDNKSASQMLIRTIDEATSTGTSFALAAREDKGTNKSPTRDQLLKIVNRLNGKTFDWTGFEANCETLARSIINDIPVSTQSRNVSTLTTQLTKTMISALAPDGYRRRAVKQQNVIRLVQRTLMRRDTQALLLTPSSVRFDFLMMLSGGKGKPCGEGWISSKLNCGNNKVHSAYESAKSAQGRLKAEKFNATLLYHKTKIVGRGKGITLHQSENPTDKREAYNAVFNVRDKVGLFVAGEATQSLQYLRRTGIAPEGTRVFTVLFNLGGTASAAGSDKLSRTQRLKAISQAALSFEQITKQLPKGTIVTAEAYDPDDAKKSKKNSLYQRFGFKPNKAGDALLARIGENGKIDKDFDPARLEMLYWDKVNKQAEELAARTARGDSALRLDKKCGGSGIPDNAKCTKGGSWPQAATIGAALTAGGIAAFALTRGGSSRTKSSPEGGPPRLPGLTPRGLLSAAPPRKSKTQRMRENTAAAARGAEQAIGRAAQAEITRAGAVANAMASAGEATGMAAKTTLRELRLRTEAARRRFEPGYRRSPAATPKRPAQLSPGMDPAFEVPLNPPRRRSPEAAPVDPRTGQPRRRRARGFGRPTGDNYIPFYAPVTLRKNR